MNNRQWNLNRSALFVIQENAFENSVWKMPAILLSQDVLKMRRTQLINNAQVAACRSMFVARLVSIDIRGSFTNREYHQFLIRQ